MPHHPIGFPHRFPPISRLWVILAGLLIPICAACQIIRPMPAAQYTEGDILLREPFDEAWRWERYEDPVRGANFRVENGAYRAEIAGPGILWGLNATQHTDVVITVSAQLQSEEVVNAYGLMCRATESNNGDGYYFLISGDGAYTIRRGSQDNIPPLVAWATSAALQQGQGAINRLRAVCIGDYLAFYANGQFLADTRDRRYQHGYAGLVAAAIEGNPPTDVTFDSLTIAAGMLVEE